MSLFARAQTTFFGFNTLGAPTFDDANSNGRTASLIGRIGGTTHLFDGRLESSLFAGQVQNDRRYLEPLAPPDLNQTSADDRYHSYRTDVQWNNTLHLDDFVGRPWLSATAMTFGYEYTGDTAKVRTNDNFGGFAFAQDALASMVNHAIHAGLQATVLQRLTLTGQVRHDWINGDSPSTWRVGAVYELKEIGSHLKVAYGTGFRVASLFDRYGIDFSGFHGNPLLRPERSEGWEAGFTSDIPTPWRVDFLTLGATYFDQRIRDLIVGVFSPHRYRHQPGVRPCARGGDRSHAATGVLDGSACRLHVPEHVVGGPKRRHRLAAIAPPAARGIVRPHAAADPRTTAYRDDRLYRVGARLPV